MSFDDTFEAGGEVFSLRMVYVHMIYEYARHNGHADLLDALVDQTLEVMNGGGRLDDAIHSVRPPAGLESRPYLRPVYDEPEFIVRNTWRLYGGWWDGNPATLKPAPERALAAETALRLAGHLAELARLAAPGDGAIGEIHRRVFTARADAATSTMAKGVFRWAAQGGR